MVKLLRATTRFQFDFAQAIWERLHWVYMPEPSTGCYQDHPELVSLHQSRKTRSAKLMEARSRLIREFEALGKLYDHQIWFEPGLWVVPDISLEWILEHSSFNVSLADQAAALDQREPCRAYWTVGPLQPLLDVMPKDMVERRNVDDVATAYEILTEPGLDDLRFADV